MGLLVGRGILRPHNHRLSTVWIFPLNKKEPRKTQNWQKNNYGCPIKVFIDSKPIEVCRVARGKRCKMGRTGEFSKASDFGFCASQNTYYYGYKKLHAICGYNGVIHSYDLSKASVADINYMKNVKLQYYDCSIYGDRGILEPIYNWIYLRLRILNLNAHTDSINKHGNRHSFHLQRQERGLKRSSHNWQSSS